MAQEKTAFISLVWQHYFWVENAQGSERVHSRKAQSVDSGKLNNCNQLCQHIKDHRKNTCKYVCRHTNYDGYSNSRSV